MNSFANFFRSFGAGRMMIMVGVAIGVAATLAFTIFNVGSKDMGLLFSGLDLKESSAVTAALDQAGIKYKQIGDGSAIQVERDKVVSTRMMLSGKGLITTGSVGYEIFDNISALGQTEFQQNINNKRALQGELERTIKGLNGVTVARVQLNLPDHRRFEQTPEETTASVVVGYTRQPDAEQVAAVQNLVALATTGLKPDHVVVVDQRTGKTMAGGDSNTSGTQMAAQRRLEVEQALEQRARQMVETIVGVGKAHVSVTADLDQTRITTHNETFDPDGQVVRSSQTSENNSSNGTGGVGGPTTVAGNVPGGATDATSGTQSSSTGGTSETTNFEISKTEKTEVIEPGKINRLTVAVVVDGIQPPPGRDGKPGAWAPRSAEDLAKIDALVKTAVGYNAERDGPNAITVSNMRFEHDAVDNSPAPKASLLSGFDKNDMMRGGELLVLLIVAGLTIFFVARPLLKGAGAGGGGMMPMPMRAGAGGGGSSSVLSGPSGPLSAQLAYDPAGGGNATAQAIANAQAADRGIDIARIEGQVKASAVKQVSDFVDRHPDESVSILRSWLHDA